MGAHSRRRRNRARRAVAYPLAIVGLGGVLVTVGPGAMGRADILRTVADAVGAPAATRAFPAGAAEPGTIGGATAPGEVASSAGSAPAPTAAATGSTAATTTNPASANRASASPASAAPGGGPVAGPRTEGLLTFRGNATRTFHGTGPLPASSPAQRWRFPGEGGLCSTSVDQSGPSVWCGTGWTGQPAVFERAGRTWVVFGAYDGAVHFLDAATGERLLPDFPTGDLVKGSVSVDPDGYPLVYVGSRDSYLRVLAIDGPEPRELWSLSAYDVSPTMWNDDWDGAPLVTEGLLVEGGENGQLHVVELNRSYGPDGRVQVEPRLVFNAPGWDDELLEALGDSNVSIEGSVALHEGVAYFANSGGLVQGWDLAPLHSGGAPERVFRWWAGDDVDATVVVDEDGMLYVGVEYESLNARSEEVGQIL
ncbi:MAG: hypothetical protein GEV08_17870, partial [Acidimicrobiia bacterium]|nr:hypothetical protein [Acidimicrobiia bacterium]